MYIILSAHIRHICNETPGGIRHNIFGIEQEKVTFHGVCTLNLTEFRVLTAANIFVVRVRKSSNLFSQLRL